MADVAVPHITRKGVCGVRRPAAHTTLHHTRTVADVAVLSITRKGVWEVRHPAVHRLLHLPLVLGHS